MYREILKLGLALFSMCDHPECNPFKQWAQTSAPVRCSRITVAKYKCETIGCISAATFNVEGRDRGRFCGAHKLAHMVNVLSKRCEHTDCDSKQPGFGFINSKPQFCSKHKLDGMINLKEKLCAFSGCEAYAAWGSEKAMFCSEHKGDSMLNIKRKTLLCIFTGCQVTSSYGLVSGSKTHCASHKTEGMVCLKTKKTCEFTGCTLSPSFNVAGLVAARFCSKHKHDGMVDVKSKRCLFIGCTVTAPAFGSIGGLPQYCLEHKKDGMVNVKSKKCDHNGCDSINRNFDIVGGKGRFCSQHKLEGMVDVKTILCIFDGCGKSALYGKPGNKRSHCASHRQPGMIKKPNATCVDCSELAIYGLNWTATHCLDHKVDGELNLIERPCASCGLDYVLNTDDKCEYCVPAVRVSVALAKQNALMDFLDSAGLRGLSTDKIVDGGACGKERPDRIFDFGDKIVILECDEFQHKERACECEQTRMINIGQSFGGLPVYFIRWNPDNYKTKGSCESISKRHKLVSALLKDIQNGLALPLALTAALYMYYDGWSGLASESWSVLVPYV